MSLSFTLPSTKRGGEDSSLGNCRRFSWRCRQPVTATANANTNTKPLRLWSSLSQDMKHQPGSVLGAAALITGTTVGAGILALPVVTAPSGFVAASATLGGFALFSIVTGLLVVEVNISTLQELGSGKGVSLSSMARRTLGNGGATAVSAAYILIHYSLLVAYIAKAGETLNQLSGLPLAAGSIVFAATLGGLCFAVRPATLNNINTFLVGLFVLSFLGLAGLTAADMQPQQLAVANWGAVPNAVPVIALAFIYQNVVPVVVSNLEGNVVKIRQAVALGVAFSWLMFEIWLAAVLGSPSLTGAALSAADPQAAVAAAAANLADPLAALRDVGGPVVGPLTTAFTLLAVGTSFIAFVIGLSDFMADALQLPTGRRQALPYVLTVVPPLAFAMAFPDVFYHALDFAGSYGVLTLFGLIPVAMCWSERYGGTSPSRQQLVPGGRPLLLAVAATAGGVIGRELLIATGQL